MHFDQLKQLLLGELGFRAVDTGGGCMVWEWRNSTGDCSLLLTQWPAPGLEDSGAPHRLPWENLPWTVSLVDVAYDECQPKEETVCTSVEDVLTALVPYFDRVHFCHICSRVVVDSSYCDPCMAEVRAEEALSPPKNPRPMTDAERYRARDLFESSDCFVADDAQIEVCCGGRYVQTWQWVSEADWAEEVQS